MNRTRFLSIALALGVVLSISGLLAGCSRTGPLSPESVLAKVNGNAVLYSEYQSNLEQLRSDQDEASKLNPKLTEKLRVRALNEIVVMHLLRHEGAKKQIRIAKEEVESRLTNWKDGYPPGGFEEMLRKQNTTEDFLRKRITDQLLVEKLSTALFATETLVSDDEMKSYFTQHEADFVRPERVHVLQIVVPTKEEAEKIRAQVVANEMSFESAARKSSMSPDAAKGGDLGYFSRNEKIAAFNEAFSLPVGTVSKPISSRYGVHLLKVIEKQPQRKLAFNEAKADLVKQLKRSKEVKVFKEWVTKLLKDSEVYYNERLFKSSDSEDNA